MIDEEGQQVGIIPTEQAMAIAEEKGFDLVEVAGDARPPVCRIMDYSKYVYEQKRRQKLAKKKTVQQETKEVKLRPNIDQHDFSIKLKRAREFLEKGNKVKITLRFRPREMRHQEIGQQVLDQTIAELSDLSSVESHSRGHNMRMLTILLAPKKSAPSKAEEK